MSIYLLISPLSNNKLKQALILEVALDEWKKSLSIIFNISLQFYHITIGNISYHDGSAFLT